MFKKIFFANLIFASFLLAGCSRPAPTEAQKVATTGGGEYVYLRHGKSSEYNVIFRVQRVTTSDGLYCYSTDRDGGIWCRPIPDEDKNELETEILATDTEN